jgi:hypothetical protein
VLDLLLGAGKVTEVNRETIRDASTMDPDRLPQDWVDSLIAVRHDAPVDGVRDDQHRDSIGVGGQYRPGRRCVQ